MRNNRAKKLWSMSVVGSKVVRIGPDVFQALQKIAVEEGMESSTPGEILKKVFKEKGILGKTA